jgi:HAE1 family hydrophobic/amphiphilic exporter-1
MFYAGILLFGIISLSFLRQELFPPITYPQLSIVTNYENAAPEEIENLITKPIEEAVGSTAGLKSLSSISREGLSVVVAEFGWNQNMDFAALGVREKIDLMKARLPRDAEEPTVIKFNPFELPVMTLSVSSDQRTPVQLKRLAEKWFKDEVEKINGVASASISGGQDEEILVAVDQGRLKATGIGIKEVTQAIASANLNYPGGTIKESFYEYLVRTMGEFKAVGEIEKVPIGKAGQDAQRPQNAAEAAAAEKKVPELVLLKDVATVKRTTQQRTTFSRFNGIENVTISIQKQASANTIRVVDMIKKRLKELENDLPEDVQVHVIYDQAKFVRSAINGVRDAAVQGGFLAFLVLVIFLRRFLTSTLVLLITPVTILATFTLMYFMGISLNVISLGGIALGVGMLGDNAIVLIENAFRKMSEAPTGDLREDIRIASEEVVAPMFASSLTTVFVFLPMIFVTGIAGQIFKELALVVVATQMISIVVAFTLLPVLMVKFRVKGQDADSDAGAAAGGGGGPVHRVLAAAGRPVAWIQNFFRVLVPRVLAGKKPYILGVIGLFVFSLFLFTRLDRIMMPKVDQGQFMIKVDMPVGTRVEVVDRVTRGIEAYLRGIPDVDTVAAVVGSARGSSTKEVVQRIGSHQAQVIVTLKASRSRPTDVCVQEIRRTLDSDDWNEKLRGARVGYVLYESSFQMGGEQSSPIVLNVQGSDLRTLKRLAEESGAAISKIQGVYDVSNSFPESSPETKIVVNKDKASFYRLSVTDLATAAHTCIKGVVSTQFKEEGREIPVRVVLEEGARNEVDKLPFVLMHSPLGVDVPLGDIVTFSIGRGPSEIKRISQERTVQVYGKVFDRSLNDVLSEIRTALGRMRVSEGYSVNVVGASLEMEESFASLCLALILSIVLVYMVMAAQFESYFQPFIIMFTVPLALIGVAFALWLTGTPISVVALLGVILLGGIIVNNGIILIDFTNQMVAEGQSLRDAVTRASAVRLRPILMTAFSSILGLLPLAMGLDEGSKLQAPMAIVVMGGILVGTFLTLVFIPAFYESATGLRVKLFGSAKARAPAGEASP